MDGVDYPVQVLVEPFAGTGPIEVHSVVPQGDQRPAVILGMAHAFAFRQPLMDTQNSEGRQPVHAAQVGRGPKRRGQLPDGESI